MTTTVDTRTGGPRRVRLIVFAVLAVGLLGVAVIAGGYFWQQRFGASQTSAADCALAEQLLVSGQQLPSDEAAVAK
jgi:hypothetical protein